MRLRLAFLALAVLLPTAHCQSSGGSNSATDGATAGDLSRLGPADLSSGLGDAGADLSRVMKIASCTRSCIGTGDCSQGTAAFDADNYSCTASVCVYKGCNTDNECKSSFSDNSYICRPVAGLPTCVKGCASVSDCNLGSAAFDADNYNCTAGFCAYKGCNNDSECQASFANNKYVCRPLAGLPTCGKGCSSVNDCNLGSPAFDVDNYDCIAGFCTYKGCNSDDECRSTFGNGEYVCI